MLFYQNIIKTDKKQQKGRAGMEAFAIKLTRLRKRRLLSGMEMAKRLNVSQSTYYNYENGVTEPTVSILQNICRVLGCRPQDLADFPEAMLTDQEWEEAERRNKGGGRR